MGWFEHFWFGFQERKNMSTSLTIKLLSIHKESDIILNNWEKNSSWLRKAGGQKSHFCVKKSSEQD